MTRRLAVVAILLVACASREQALTRTLAGLDAMRAALVAADEAHQAGIVAGATSLEDGKAKLAAYRAARAKVVAALVGAYTALALASIDTSAGTLGQVVTTAAAAWAAYRELGIGGAP